MPKGLNKKVLCFVDEYGTAGTGSFHLGAVLVHARDAGRIDKCFSDLLEPSANEIHAVDLDDGYLQGLLQRFWENAPRERVVLLNHKLTPRAGPAFVQYAQAVIDVVKVGLKVFQKDVLGQARISNVDVIMDANHHNCHPGFQAEISRARQQDGRFRAVNGFACVDSAASRLLQLAGVVAHAHKWIVREELNAAGLRDRFGIRMP
jgi:hypothetical protein